jgi:hypothetical protein
MGYVNKDRRIVTVGRKEKRAVMKLRRAALKRELRGEHERSAARAKRRGWWFA